MKNILMGGAVLLGMAAAAETTEASLGELLYFDTDLSYNRTQSCATCHNPERGFVDDRDNGIGAMVSLGDDGKSLGERNAPTAAYARYSPHFGFDAKKQRYRGGQFLDGREATLAAQAGGPPMNPVEMGMPSKTVVFERLKEKPIYVEAFTRLYGTEVFADAPTAYGAMTRAIAAFEKTPFFAPFDSKYDRYLRGEYELSDLEDLGQSLFFSNNNTNCAACHVLKGEGRKGETFSNYEYHNIGVPSNPVLFARGVVEQGFRDKGLLNHPEIDTEEHAGAFKVPTLRNVAVTGPYMHNGVFKELWTVVAFYDHFNNPERALNPETGVPWGAPEIVQTVNREDLKAKRLTDRKIDALVAFLKTLTDRRYEHLIKE